MFPDIMLLYNKFINYLVALVLFFASTCNPWEINFITNDHIKSSKKNGHIISEVVFSKIKQKQQKVEENR